MAEESAQSETDPKPAKKSPEFKGPVRWSIALNVLLQMILAAVIFGGANYLGFKHYTIFDRTYNAQYTLSEDTRKLIRTLDKKIEIIILTRKGQELQKELYQLSQQFRSAGEGRISVRMIDPYKDIQDWRVLTDEAREAKIELGYGIYLRVKRTKEQTADASHYFVPEDDLVKPVLDEQGKLVRKDFLAETAISSGIIAITRKDKPKIALVAKKGAIANSGSGTPVDVLQRMAERQNWQIEPILLQDPTMGRSSSDDIPSDVRALVFLGPSVDMEDGELGRVRRYWEGNKSGILVFLNNQATPMPNLYKFLTENGIEPREDRIMLTLSGTGGPSQVVDVAFLDGSPVTSTLVDTNALLYGQTRSLAMKTDLPKVRDENILIKPLLQANERYWGEVSYRDPFPHKDPTDHTAPLYVAASAERGASKDQLVGIDSSRMIVVANNSMLDPASLQQPNYDFIGASLNWLMHDEKFVGINPKEKQIFKMDLSESQQQRIFLITTVILPLAVFMLGMAIWSIRRS